jgi:hypothetical protein
VLDRILIAGVANASRVAEMDTTIQTAITMRATTPTFTFPIVHNGS